MPCSLRKALACYSWSAVFWRLALNSELPIYTRCHGLPTAQAAYLDCNRDSFAACVRAFRIFAAASRQAGESWFCDCRSQHRYTFNFRITNVAVGDAGVGCDSGVAWDLLGI